MKRFLALLLCAMLVGGMFTTAWADPGEIKPVDPQEPEVLSPEEPEEEGSIEPLADPDPDEDETPIATDIYLWLGEIEVGSANADDPLDDGSAKFDPSTNTLTFTKSPTITGLHDGALIDAPGLETLTIVTPASGLSISNKTASRIISVPEGSLTVEGKVSITFESPDREVAILVGKGLTVNGNLDVDSCSYEDNQYTGTAVMCEHGPVTINGDLFCASEVGVMCADGDIAISNNAVFIADAWGSNTYCLRALNGHSIED